VKEIFADPCDLPGLSPPVLLQELSLAELFLFFDDFGEDSPLVFDSLVGFGLSAMENLFVDFLVPLILVVWRSPLRYFVVDEGGT